jgi:hypothetical protein
MEYRIVTVASDAGSQLEQLGTKAKFWFRTADGTRTLFKEGYPGSGEHWAEKLACEVARGLGLPHADYDLAVWNDRPGVVSPMFVPEGGRLIHGNELLARTNAGYNEKAAYRCSQHTLSRVIAVLRSPQIDPPLGWSCPVEVGSAPGVFVGYLLLDALIGNQDRHHQNWGLLKVPGGGLTLAPTFDHASSLGRNETDAKRGERLTTRDKGNNVASYVRRATSGLYETKTSTRPMMTFDVYCQAAAWYPNAARYWRARLRALGPETLDAIVQALPESVATETAKRFALLVMLENRTRLLEPE